MAKEERQAFIPIVYPNKMVGCRECGIYLFPIEKETGLCSWCNKLVV